MRVFTRDAAASAWIERAPRADSVIISDTINERSTATVTLIDPTGVTRYRRGDSIKIENAAGTALFVGFIDAATESRLGIAGHRTHTLECVDLHYLADKRVIARGYSNQTAGSIVADAYHAYLAGEGVTLGTIQPGPTIRAVTFNYITVADAFRELALRAGFWWRIDPAGVLTFASALEFLTALAGSESTLAGDSELLAGASAGGEGGSAPTVNLTTIALADSVSVTRHSPSFRNRQWVRGGMDRTAPQFETMAGDGEARAFVLGFPVAEEPTVQVSRAGGPYVTESVGAAGIQTGQSWSYSFGSNVISQRSANPVLTSADRVLVTYRGLYDVIARVDDVTLQAERALAEGGSGVIEHVVTDRTSETRDAAFQLAGELIAYFGRPATVVRFATTETFFHPGLTVAVTFEEAGIVSGDALVTTVESFTVGGHERAVVTLVIGPMTGSWAQWFGALSRRLDKLTEPRGGEVEVVTTFEQFTKTWTLAETPNIFRETRAGTALASGSTFPEFEPQHRVTHLAWFAGGVELGRKAFTAQTNPTADVIVTTTVLVTNDAVGDIQEFGWFGGWLASNAVGSGVEVDRQAFVRTKTEVEQIQVEKTDERWS